MRLVFFYLNDITKLRLTESINHKQFRCSAHLNNIPMKVFFLSFIHIIYHSITDNVLQFKTIINLSISYP